MDKTVLLTLGRLPKGLELARALHQAGARVIVADPFATHLSKPSRAVSRSYQVPAPNDDLEAFMSALEDIIVDEGVDIVAPVSEEVLYVSLLAGRVSAHVRLMTPPVDGLLKLHDKYQFSEMARAAGIAMPQTWRADDARSLELINAGDTVLKPALGCSGNGLRFLSRGQLPSSSERTHDNIIQERIEGREISSFSIVRDGVSLGTVLYEGLIFSGTVSTAFRRVGAALSATDWIEQFVRHHDYSGFIAFDFIVDDAEKAWPIECNPRLTSGIHFMNSAGLAAAVLGESLPEKIGMRPQSTFQEGHTSLLEAYGSFFRPGEFFAKLKTVFSTPDILWSVRDPLPFLLMTPMSWPVLRQVLFSGRSFGEAATHDIEWKPDTPLVYTPTQSPPFADQSRADRAYARFSDDVLR